MMLFSRDFMKSNILSHVPAGTDVILTGADQNFLFHAKYLETHMKSLAANKIDICFETERKDGMHMEHLLRVIGDRPDYMQNHRYAGLSNINDDIKSDVSAVFPRLNRHGEVREDHLLLNGYRILNAYLKVKTPLNNFFNPSVNPLNPDKAYNKMHDDPRFNIMPYSCAPYSTIRMRLSAKAHNVGYSFVGCERLNDSSYTHENIGFTDEDAVLTHENIGLHNIRIAEKIVSEINQTGKRKLYYGDSSHLFSFNTRDSRTEHGEVSVQGLQSVLQDKYGLKTYTVAMFQGIDDFNPVCRDNVSCFFNKAIPDWFENKRWKALTEELKDTKKEVFVDMRKYAAPEKVGKEVPDMLLVFPAGCQQWQMDNYPKLKNYNRSPMTEADMWHRMDSDFKLKP